MSSGVVETWRVSKYDHTAKPSWRKRRTGTLVLGELAEMIGFTGVFKGNVESTK